MHDPGNGLPRLPLLGTSVNKGKEKARAVRPRPLTKALRYLFLLAPPHFFTVKNHTFGWGSASTEFWSRLLSAISVTSVVMVAR